MQRASSKLSSTILVLLASSLMGCAAEGETSCGLNVFQIDAEGDFAAILGYPSLTSDDAWIGFYFETEDSLFLYQHDGVSVTIPHLATILRDRAVVQDDPSCGPDAICVELDDPSSRVWAFESETSRWSRISVEANDESGTSYTVTVTAGYLDTSGGSDLEVNLQFDLLYRSDGCPAPSESSSHSSPGSGNDDDAVVGILGVLAFLL